MFNLTINEVRHCISIRWDKLNSYTMHIPSEQLQSLIAIDKHLMGYTRCMVECTPIEVWQLFCWPMTPFHHQTALWPQRSSCSSRQFASSVHKLTHSSVNWQYLFSCSGETEENRLGIIQGQEDTVLNEVGRQQARLASEKLSCEIFTSIYSSDLMRAKEVCTCTCVYNNYTYNNVGFSVRKQTL